MAGNVCPGRTEDRGDGFRERSFEPHEPDETVEVYALVFGRTGPKRFEPRQAQRCRHCGTVYVPDPEDRTP
jgi:hypothetical protein